ncbi:MAG: BBP7 family outer membrane beta-barrel protein [Planctomycetales bacterium]|nr:BBP7 family outer membrane beta-barrel protein [Planctomycetales bacterium]
MLKRQNLARWSLWLVQHLRLPQSGRFVASHIAASVAFAVCLMAASPVEAQSPSNSGRQARGPVRPGNTSRSAAPARKQAKPHDPVVTAASHQEIIEGDVILDGGYEVQGSNIGCDSCGGGGCDSCSVGGPLCDSCHVPHRFCICFPAHGWVHAEYLLWYQSGMRLPPLVTTGSGANQATAGVLGAATTSTLFGDDVVQDGDRSGFRIRFGWWLGAFPGWGVEGEYVGLGENTETFTAASTGTPVLARPFFNVLTGAEDAQLLAFPAMIGGDVTATTTSQLDGAAVRFRRQLYSTSGCGYSPWYCQTVPTSTRLDGTVGYRFWELDESLQIQERLTSQLPAPDDGTFNIVDRFATRNQFNGGEIGFMWQGRRGWWSMDALMRLGIGNVHQTVTVSGTSTIVNSVSGTNTTANGILAQRTNIGTFERNEFTMVPELGVTLGYQLTRRLRMTAGYSLVYWGNVVRPGDQVDLNVNPELFAPEVSPFTGANRPQFQFVETDYWVHGLNFGGEFRW